MKQLEEEFGLDREIGTETDDEENEAERAVDGQEYDNESDVTGPIRIPSRDVSDLDPTPHWPQSYRYVLHSVFFLYYAYYCYVYVYVS